MAQAQKKTAYYHLPGLFEFYELYRMFLPLYREHREYFYDWCEIGSIYGAPADCLWGGGRAGFGENDAGEVLTLLQEYGISARLTFSNSLLRAEHLADAKCNALCRRFCAGRVQNGVIIHSDLLADYLRAQYPALYLVSSTTKVLTEFAQLRQELQREAFRYVVPDFRLNKAFAQLDALPRPLKDKVEFLCNECCWVGWTAGAAMKTRAAKTLASPARTTAAPRRGHRRDTAFPKRWRTPALSVRMRSAIPTCPWAFPTSSWRAGGWAVHWCWNFCCIT